MCFIGIKQYNAFSHQTYMYEWAKLVLTFFLRSNGFDIKVQEQIYFIIHTILWMLDIEVVEGPD